MEEAYALEKPHLAPLPILPEPFDLVVTRTVAPDCTLAFEGRAYSVPFVHVGAAVEVRGCAARVHVMDRPIKSTRSSAKLVHLSEHGSRA